MRRITKTAPGPARRICPQIRQRSPQGFRHRPRCLCLPLPRLRPDPAQRRIRLSSGEPSARQLARLADYCRANDVRTIFVEDMVSPKTSETLAREVGARVETIHTIETSEDDESYLDRMRDNLEKIYASSLR